jgi:hypothetical protein
MNTSATFNSFLRLGLLLALSASASHADEAIQYPRCFSERVVMRSSSAEIPSPIQKPKVVVPLGCDRPFSYRGDVYSTDSAQAQDAANLKNFVKSVPEADATIAEYQNNREKSKISAYTGTLGLLIAMLAPPISNQFTGPSRTAILAALRVSGIAIAAGGFFYSFTLLRSNESLLPKAVGQYNQAKPNDPIELQFSTGWSF